MAFDSFGAFLAMEGHGPYVWACYAVFFLLMAMLMVGSYRRRNAVLQSCRQHPGARSQQAPKPDSDTAPAAAASFARVDVSQD
ncbi:MAG TPA: heme exporter protein CcmD [Marinobacter sp.]|nr:heme exporter protein CcmD [Marinobacter sp.]